jgi:hypothetical protein
MKKIRRDKQIGVIMHIYMEISQGNSLCIYLYLKHAKMSFLSYFFYKTRKQEGGTGPGGEVGTSGRGEVTGKESARVTLVQKLCTHVCKCKNDTC